MTGINAQNSAITEIEENFVDLYAILGVAPSASEAELRRRIGSLYTEAQENLDHRSFRKRFYYLELYEVHLPHAHNALLHEERRAEYNALRARHLQAKQQTAKAAGGQGKAVPGAKPSRPGAVAAPAGSRPAGARPGTAARPPAGAGPAPATPQRPAGAQATIKHAPDYARMDKETVERRRDGNRRELIKNELRAAGMRAGLSLGVAAFVALGALLVLGSGVLGAGPMVQSSLLAVAAGVSALVARTASRSARRNIISTLSQMPYEELLMRYSH